MSDAVLKLSKWTIFGVLVSLLPLAFSYLNLVMHGQPLVVEKVLGDGELLIVVCAMSAAAIGEVIGSKETLRIWKVVSGGLTMLLLLVAATLFSIVADGKFAEKPIGADHVALSSGLLFVCSLISGASCVALSEL